MKSRHIAQLALTGLLALPLQAWSHCDSLEGPVVRDARAALASGSVTPVLKWVSKDQEQEIIETFRQTMAVRSLGDDAKALADRHFFETLVRVHRAGEGEAFTGLKAAGEVEPGIAAADAALSAGSPDELVEHLSAAATAGTRSRFTVAMERRRKADESVDAGRAYVEAYVDFIHFVENLDHLVTQGAPHGHQQDTP